MPPFLFSLNSRRVLVTLLLGVWSFSSLQAQPRNAVKTAPANRPELALQVGHSLSVFALAYSPDGNFLASGAGDGTLKIWNVRSRELLRTIPAHAASVRAVVWSGEPSTLASASEDGTVKFWDAGDGKLLRTIAARRNRDGKTFLKAFTCAFDADGSTLAVGYGEFSGDDAKGELVLYNARDGKLRRVVSRDCGGIYALAFSPRDNLLASGGSDSIARLWNAQTGAAIRNLSGHNGAISSLAFSPDGSTLASGSWDKSVRVWKIAGESVRVLRNHSESVQAVAFSPDGNTLVSSGIDRKVVAWDARRDFAVRETATLKRVSYALAFSPKGNTFRKNASENDTLAVGSWSAIDLRDAENLVLDWTFEERPRWMTVLEYSPNGKMLAASGGSDHLIYLWDAQSGRLLRTLKSNAWRVQSVAWSPDSKTLAGEIGQEKANGNFPILLWRASDGAILRKFPGHQAPISSLAFSPNGSTLASGASDQSGPNKRGQIKLWNPQNGALQRTLIGQPGWADSLSWTPNSKTLASGNGGQDNKGVVEIWNPQNGKLIRTLTGFKNWVSEIAFARDGSTLAAASRDQSISIWNAQSGAKLKTFTQSSPLRSMAFSPDGSTLASGASDALIRVWNVKTGKIARVLRGHEFSVDALSFSPTGSTLASGSADTSIRLWKTNESRQLAALLTAPSEVAERAASLETLWLTTTPEGYYDSAEGADYLVKWRFQDRLLPFHHFEETYRRPDILRRALAGERIAARPLLLSRVPPMIRFIRPQSLQVLTGKTVRVLVEAADDGALDDFQMYVNGVLVPESVAKPIVVDGKPIIVDGKPIIVDGKPIVVDGKPIVVDGKTLSPALRPIVAENRPITADGRGLEDAQNVQEYAMRRLFIMDIPIVGGADEFILRALVTDNEQNKSDAAVVVKSAARLAVQSDLHLLCVGVSQYRNPNYNIGFAAADAVGIAGVLQAQQGRQYGRVKTTVLTDKQATMKNIRVALAELKNAKPNDTVMIFLSGHGLRSNGKFYFAPWGTFINDIPGTCLEWDELLGALRQVYSRKLLFTDACFSGSKLGDRQATSGELVELAHKDSGLVMLSSSQADEFSFEQKDAAQGAFSLALMEAFAGKSDVDNDGEITLSELALYVPRRVSTLTRGLQNPQFVLMQDFNPQTILAKTVSSKPKVD